MSLPGPDKIGSKQYKLSCFFSVVLVILFISLADTEKYMEFVSTSLKQTSSDCVKVNEEPKPIVEPSHSKNSNDNGGDDDYNDDDEFDDKVPDYVDSGGTMPFQSFNVTNPYPHWCPNAACNNSPMCQPCKRRYLFILATARSGSTTLLKMLNFLPNIRLSGENRNELYIASLLQSELRKTNVLEQNFDRVEGAYIHNAIAPQSMSCAIQGVMNAINPPPKRVQNEVNITGRPSLEEYDRDLILGAKTIRFQKGDWTVKESADYLRENFPCSRIVVNIRSDLEGQAESIENTFNDDGTDSGLRARDRVERMNNFLLKLAKELGDDMAHLLDMNEWTKDVKSLNKVVRWLGFKRCDFARVVHENSNGYGRDKETDPGIDDECHYAY